MWRWCTIVTVVILVLAAAGVALAQDRPLLEPLRVGYTRSDPVGEALRRSVSLQAALRRKGYVPDWRVFAAGFDAVTSLDTGELDLALNIPLGDVVAARRARLKMVFIAELRSTAPTCCELEQQFADHTLRRYTLSSEYLADSREDVLLILHQEILRVLRGPAPQVSARPGPTVVVLEKQQHLAGALTSPVTRDTMQRASETAGRLSGGGLSTDPSDLSDVNYWAPYE